MSDALSKKLRETAIKHLDAYASPNPWDIDAILAVRTSNFTHDLHPKGSLDPAYRGNIDEGMLRYFVGFFKPVLGRVENKVQWMAVDPEKKTVVTAFECITDLVAVGDEPAEPNYSTEYMWYTKMNEAGDKIEDVQEFLDVQRMTNYVGAKAAKLAQLQGGGQGHH